MITAGIDIGSLATKAVLMSEEGVVASHVRFTGYSSEKAGRAALDELLRSQGLTDDELDWIIATGYGRKNVPFAKQTLTEIICHAAGAHYQDEQTNSIIDIGGQDSKVIILERGGKVKDFVMNDKCAAGTGRFLEVMARALEMDLEEFATTGAEADPACISNLCTVFAESEVISLIAKGTPREEIVAGIHRSVAVRVGSMARRIGIREPVMMTGGAAHNQGLVASLEKDLQVCITVPRYPQLNGALGAAVLAQKRA